MDKLIRQSPTGASWLIQSNVLVAYVREILGHSSILTSEPKVVYQTSYRPSFCF